MGDEKVTEPLVYFSFFTPSVSQSGYKVFVGGLSLNTDKESLKAFFEQYGEIVDSVVMRDPVTKRSRGFGFVTYSEGKSMDDCLEGAPHVVGERERERARASERAS